MYFKVNLCRRTKSYKRQIMDFRCSFFIERVIFIWLHCTLLLEINNYFNLIFPGWLIRYFSRGRDVEFVLMEVQYGYPIVKNIGNVALRVWSLEIWIFLWRILKPLTVLHDKGDYIHKGPRDVKLVWTIAHWNKFDFSLRNIRGRWMRDR